MEITYSHSKLISKHALQDLFLSVGWESGKFPDDLEHAMENSHSVVTAWDGEKLVGLINALSDGVMTAYFHYMLVRPDYQGHGIGKQLMFAMLEMYRDYKTKVLISYPGVELFYESFGFRRETGTIPLFISDLV